MFELLCRVPTVIERDALIHALTQEDIDVVTPERDVMVKLGSEPNLYLGSASALFEGYDVRVRPATWPGPRTCWPASADNMKLVYTPDRARNGRRTRSIVTAPVF